MKNFSIYSLAMLMMAVASCATTDGLPKEKVASLLQKGEFTFMAQRANPTNYDVVNVMNSLPNSSSSRMLNLDYGYTVKLTKNEVSVELPYFGRMYTPSYDTTKNSYRFTTKDYVADQRAGKKNSMIYTVLPKDQTNVQKIVLEIFPQGKTYVNIVSNDRQPISYDGYIMENTAVTK